jgi:prepilin-type N-terminal cleavage/methylation domain-containing protein
MRKQRGFSLIEMLVVVVVLGVATLIGLPRIGAGMNKANVRGARTTLINLLSRTRIAATETNRITVLKVEGNNVSILLRPRRLPGAGDADTLGEVMRLGDAYGVTITAPIDSVRFDPRGLAAGFGSGTTFLLTRNGVSDSVRIDGLGRITK